MGKLNFHARPGLVFFLIVFVSVGPLLLSYVLVRNADRLDLGDRSHGILLQPPAFLGEKILIALEKESDTTEQIQGRWSLLYWSDTECLLPCVEKVLHMIRIRKGLGRNAYRLRNVISSSSDSFALPDSLPRNQLFLWRAEEEEDPLLYLYETKRIEGPGRIYIIDPHGNLLMSYDNDADPSGIVKDLELLMRASKVG